MLSAHGRTPANEVSSAGAFAFGVSHMGFGIVEEI
jgi:hypothetical protein